MVGRPFTALLLADIADCSASTVENDLNTVSDLKRAAWQLIFASSFGRVIETGDGGILAEFIGVFNALKCAITMQELMRERSGRCLEFRIGITHGELLSGEDRIDGDAIKIVSRLVDLCEPGGICIPDKLYNELEGSFDVEYLDIGEQNLHDVAKPVRVFRINLTRPLPNGRQPLSNRPAWRNPRWIIAVLGVLSVAIGLGSTFTWWDLRTPTQGEDRISHSHPDGADFHADPSKL